MMTTDVTNDDQTQQTNAPDEGTAQVTTAQTEAEKAAAAALATEAAKAEESKEPEAKWEGTGDSFVDTLANGYISAGGSPEQFQALLDDVASTGALTEAAKVEIRSKFGAMAEALIPSIEQKAKAAKEWADTERKAIYDEAGSEAKFGEMQEWAKENLPDDVRAFLSQALNKGGKPAKLAVQQLKQLMIEGGATVTGEDLKPNATTTTGAETLTRQDYLNQRIALERKGDYQGIEQLQARARVALEAANKRGVRW